MARPLSDECAGRVVPSAFMATVTSADRRYGPGTGRGNGAGWRETVVWPGLPAYASLPELGQGELGQGLPPGVWRK